MDVRTMKPLYAKVQASTPCDRFSRRDVEIRKAAQNKAFH
jgi:hypothetical protein